MAGLELSPIKDDLAATLPRLREEVSVALLGGDTSRPCELGLDMDTPANDPPTWTDALTGD
ncbi:MAG: hypothetical protein ABI445_21900, partial [Polyangia bacterium]